MAQGIVNAVRDPDVYGQTYECVGLVYITFYFSDFHILNISSCHFSFHEQKNMFMMEMPYLRSYYVVYQQMILKITNSVLR